MAKRRTSRHIKARRIRTAKRIAMGALVGVCGTILFAGMSACAFAIGAGAFAAY